jgi:hypothetical protein
MLNFFLAQAPSTAPSGPTGTILGSLQGAGKAATYAGATNGASPEFGLINIISTIISMALGLTGVIFLAYIVFAAYTWMTAGGDSDKVTKAKETISRATIGLVIVLVSYAIVAYIVPMLLCASGNLNACPSAAPK